jgi:predicted DNA-binding transcriptional regulator AlpA
MPSDKQDPLLTREQVESRYGLTKRYLEVCAWRGDGPPMVKISRRMVRYRASDIEKWIADHRIDPGMVSHGAGHAD